MTFTDQEESRLSRVSTGLAALVEVKVVLDHLSASQALPFRAHLFRPAARLLSFQPGVRRLRGKLLPPAVIVEGEVGGMLELTSPAGRLFRQESWQPFSAVLPLAQGTSRAESAELFLGCRADGRAFLAGPYQVRGQVVLDLEVEVLVRQDLLLRLARSV
ncbi:MAG: hypothetical protein QJR13_00715 [Bacillota bacterium]|nr:hypothetical protein [Bacillota bacterium]